MLDEEQILIFGEMGSEIMQEKEKKLKNVRNLEVICKQMSGINSVISFWIQNKVYDLDALYSTLESKVAFIRNFIDESLKSISNIQAVS